MRAGLRKTSTRGNAISLGTVPWKPNERIIGLYRAVADDSVRGGWHLDFETLTASEKAMPLHGTHRVGRCKADRRAKEPRAYEGRTEGARASDGGDWCGDVGARH